MKIFTYEGAIASELLISLRSIQSKIKRYSQEANIKKCAKYAIKNLAKKNYVHNDLKWEHIGLFPVLVNGVIDKFEPILIDLESLEEKEKKEAKKDMKKQLKIMCDNCIFINNDDNL